MRGLFIQMWFFFAVGIGTGCGLVSCKAGDRQGSGDSGLDGTLLDAGQTDGGNDANTDGDLDSGSDSGICDEINCSESNVRYVDVDMASSGDGLSWDNAFATVQEGIDSAYTWACCCGSNSEVWVAEGKYVIYQSGDDDTVQLRPGVELYAGFMGDESSRDDRDWEEHKAVLSGLSTSNPFLHVNHVVTGSDSAVIDGFTVTGGGTKSVTLSFGVESGAGMYNVDCSPVVRNCTFSQNQAEKGGGMYNSNSNVEVEGCIFLDNGSDYGGGMYNDSSYSNITDCIFVSNSAHVSGGGMYNNNSSPELSNCIFSSNGARESGGGMTNYNDSTTTIIGTIFLDNSVSDNTGRGGGVYNYFSTPEITGCIITNNYAGGGGGIADDNSSASIIFNSIFTGNHAIGGGGVRNIERSSPIIINSILSGNIATGSSGSYGGGIFNDLSMLLCKNCLFVSNTALEGGGIYNWYSSPTLINSVLWYDTPEEIVNYDLSSVPAITYSNVQDYDGGIGTIKEDPLFTGHPLSTGTWSLESYDESLFQTELSDNSANWSAGALEGMFVEPSMNTDSRWFLIAHNTSSTMHVWGNISDLVDAGSTYRIYDLHLSEDSPCIDRGDDSEAPTTDIEGNSRVDVPGRGTSGTSADMGAYEYQP